MRHKDEYTFNRIRDPLYGFIGISERETRLINTGAFLRLQRIKQLSHAYLVYPSATHTRFEHSLGVLHVASRMADALCLSPDEKRLVRLAALLHDIGHGPFSHLFEQVMTIPCRDGGYAGHEQISCRLVTEDPELATILGNDGPAVRDLIRGGQSDTYGAMQQIVSGNLDADKLDYLRRDSCRIGANYGVFDLERILAALATSPKAPSDMLTLEKGAEALENYRLSRYLMHAQVYAHPKRLAADQMFVNAMEAAADSGAVCRDQLCTAADGLTGTRA